MSELIPIQHNDDGIQAVMGRDLHRFLEVSTEYRHWFPRMVEYGFSEGQDYAVKNDRVRDSLGREREALNHIITLDMSKEISMIQRTERGKQARQYFLECERRAKTATVDASQLTRAEILQIALNAENERLELEAKNAELTPKADAYDSFIEADGKYNVGEVAKMLGMGQNTLFRELRNRGVLISKGHMRNTPYQQYMHHFEVKARTIVHTNGAESVKHTTYVQPSGIDFIRKKLGMDMIDPPPAAA